MLEVVSYRVRFSMRDKGIRTEVIPSQYVGLSSVASPNQQTSCVGGRKAGGGVGYLVSAACTK